MADEIIKDEQQTQQQQNTDHNTRMADSFFGDMPIQNQQEAKQEEAKPAAEEKKEEQVQDPWFKQYGFEDEAKAKEGIDSWKTKSEIPPTKEEIKFVNDQSKLLAQYLMEGKEDEALEIINTKKRIDKLTSGEVTESNAADILKLSLKQKYKSSDFSDVDVERKFNKQYPIPKEPVFDETKETEDEYKDRHEDWKDKVKEIKADILLDAKIAKSDLEKLKTELVLPDIFKNESQQSQGLSQKELDDLKGQQETFVKTIESAVNGFSGFSVSLVDKDVNLSANYAPSAEEKKAINERLNAFAESGFDANAVLADRWVNPDGKTLNVTQMTEDLYRVLYGEKASQKNASDLVNQRLEVFLKDKKNINLSDTRQTSTPAPTEDKAKAMQDKFWNT